MLEARADDAVRLVPVPPRHQPVCRFDNPPVYKLPPFMATAYYNSTVSAPNKGELSVDHPVARSALLLNVCYATLPSSFINSYIFWWAWYQTLPTCHRPEHHPFDGLATLIVCPLNAARK